METAITVKTLLGQRNLSFSIECLNSFLKNSKDTLRLQIFEDGTLTQGDKDLLCQQLKNAVIIDKKERDDKLKIMLSNYPYCYEYRNNIPYAQKIFDVMLYDNNDLLFIDSDIFFTKKFKLPLFDSVPVFIADSEHAYSFTPIEFLKIKLPIYPRINSGFFFFPNSLFNLQFIENLLKDNIINQGFKRRMPWLEQAVWSFLAAKAKKVNYFNKTQIVMAERNLKTDDQTIAVHLVSTYRDHLSSVKNKIPLVIQSEKFSEITLEKGDKYLGKFEFALEKLIKRAKRELGIS